MSKKEEDLEEEKSDETTKGSEKCRQLELKKTRAKSIQVYAQRLKNCLSQSGLSGNMCETGSISTSNHGKFLGLCIRENAIQLVFCDIFTDISHDFSRERVRFCSFFGRNSSAVDFRDMSVKISQNPTKNS